MKLFVIESHHQICTNFKISVLYYSACAEHDGFQKNGQPFNKSKKPCFWSILGAIFFSKNTAVMQNFTWISNTKTKSRKN